MAAYRETELLRQVLRATGVRYHGEGDGKVVRWTVRGKTVEENGRPIRVLLEDASSPRITTKDAIFTEGFPGKFYVILAKQGGYYSGDQNCVMRDYDPGAYVSKTDPSVRYLLRGHSAPEGAGTTLCTSPRGTGVNDPGRGQVRYGDATHGSCLQSVNVSDASR
jgi:hypothetical protein